MDNLYFLPEDAVAAPASDVGAGLHSKYQQDDEGNKHQEAQDDGNGLRETHDSANPCGNRAGTTDTAQFFSSVFTVPLVTIHINANVLMA